MATLSYVRVYEVTESRDIAISMIVTVVPYLLPPHWNHSCFVLFGFWAHFPWLAIFQWMLIHPYANHDHGQ